MDKMFNHFFFLLLVFYFLFLLSELQDIFVEVIVFDVNICLFFFFIVNIFFLNVSHLFTSAVRKN